MSTGALIFANHSDKIDYVGMAAWSAKNIRRHLGLPVALVTDQPTNHDFDQIIYVDTVEHQTRWFHDLDGRTTWNNRSRPDAYDLTPWERTVVLDADYVVASRSVNLLLESDHEFICHRWARDVTDQNDFSGLNYFGAYKMPMWWATVMVFSKCLHAQVIFESMKMVRSHWSHYQQLYHDSSKIYRNDHALSIALMMANGHINNAIDIPWPLITVMPEHRLSLIDQDHYRVDYVRSDLRPAWIDIQGQDFHAMCKRHLGDIVADQI